LGGLGRCLDVGHIVRMQRRRCRNHDCKRDEVRKSHSNEGVEVQMINRPSSESATRQKLSSLVLDLRVSDLKDDRASQPNEHR
jgi:hypothetical protein